MVNIPLSSCGAVGSNPAPAPIFKKGGVRTGGAASAVTTSADLKPIIDALAAQISVGTVVEVLAAVVTACIALVFMWWGARKVTRMVMSAFKKGKLSV